MTVCPMCTSKRVTTKDEEEEFPYGPATDGVWIKCVVPVNSCKRCGFTYTDASADDIRDEAIEAYLKGASE